MDAQKTTEAIISLLEDDPLIGAALSDGEVEELAALIGKIKAVVSGAMESASDGADNLVWLQDKMRESKKPLKLSCEGDGFSIAGEGAQFTGVTISAAIKSMRW